MFWFVIGCIIIWNWIVPTDMQSAIKTKVMSVLEVQNDQPKPQPPVRSEFSDGGGVGTFGGK